MADDAGALLVRSGLVSPGALDDARSRVENLGGTVGEQLVTSGAIADDALTDFYRSRLLVPQVNPNTLARLPAKVVQAIPGDMAIELRAIPVALDGENNLTVAMSDPSDRHAVDEIQFFTGAYVVRAVATQMQIAWCLAHYYGHVTALGQRLLQGTAATSAARSGPMPRTKGVTGQVEAMRHRGFVPGEVAAPAPAPSPPPADDAPLRIQSSPDMLDPNADGVPDRPRARSVSGEIRVPGRRAPSIRPPMPEPIAEDEESGPVITMEVGEPDEDPTGPRNIALGPLRPVRKRKAKTDPPELAARAGEVSVATGPVRKVEPEVEEARIIIAEDIEAPPPTMIVTELSGEVNTLVRRADPAVPHSTIEISDDTSAGVVIHERFDRESAPIILDRKRPSDPIPALDQDTDIVVLDAKKLTPPAGAAKHPRPERRTQMGIGALPAATRAHRDTEASELGDETSVDTVAAPTGDDESSDDIVAPPPPLSSDDTNPNVLAAPPRPMIDADTTRHTATSKHETTAPGALNGDDDDDDGLGHATSVMSAVELDEAIPQRSFEVVPAHLDRRRIDYDSVDDGWGPPGTTIPPPLLGAVPGSEDDTMPGRIPVADVDDAPLIVAAPKPPERHAGQLPARAVEDATSRLLELIRTLEHAQERDEVVAVMIQYLAESHQRAGFFVIKGGELTVFAIQPRPAVLPFATLRLDRPSTFQDVVGTRLPYRGPTLDETGRQFLQVALGTPPPEILLVPVAVRERVVGVLFGEQRTRHTFDDQLALASRAAGMALERILKAKRA